MLRIKKNRVLLFNNKPKTISVLYHLSFKRAFGNAGQPEFPKKSIFLAKN
jgi:hypothetical protein